MKCLMLGSGRGKLARRFSTQSSAPESETGWVSLDCLGEPDVLFDLNSGERLPFKDEEFDEIHAYEVLEHVGRQGDWRGLFREFNEYWRILKPGGHFIGSSPVFDPDWTLGDPGHVRLISNATISYLEKAFYDWDRLSDYRPYIDPCWWMIRANYIHGSSFRFCLEKICKNA